MGEMDTMQFAEQFVQSSRTGRRNAMPDLGVENVDIGAHKLAEAFSHLEAGDEAGPSGINKDAAGLSTFWWMFPKKSSPLIPGFCVPN